MKAMIAARFYWPGLGQDIIEFLQKCSTCSKSKGSQNLRRSKLQLFPSRYPFHMVSIDIVSLPKTVTGFVACLSCLMAVDRFTDMPLLFL